MSTDCYKVDVVHYLNPSLIWVEVSDSSGKKDIVIEQVGLFGIIPHEITLDLLTESVVSSKCDNWVPAANAILRGLLSHSKEVWFQASLINKGSSIFDDNIHKYGELIIQNSEGNLKMVSKYLVESGFAEFDVCKFHCQLRNGKLNTDMDSIKTQEVLSHIEKYYTNTAKKSNWEKFVKEHASVFQIKQQFESGITVSNVEKYINPMIRKIIENKRKDFELCKDIDEKSLGRGCHRSDSVESKLTSKRLSKMMSLYEKSTSDDIKILPENNSKPIDDDSECSSPNHVENNSKSLRKINDHNVAALTRGKMHSAVKGSCERNKYKTNAIYETCKKPGTHSQVHDCDMKDENISYKNGQSSQYSSQEGNEKLNQIRFARHSENSKVSKYSFAFGPPEMDPRMWKIQRSETFGVEDVKQEPIMDDENDSSDVVDSDVDNKMDMTLNSTQMSFNLVNDDNESIMSSLFQQILKGHDDINNKESSISSSESNEESSSFGENKESFDEDEILELNNKKYKKASSLLVDKKSESVEGSSLKKYVNPIGNVDSGIFSFTDKIVTPVLMWHSKYDTRIQPVFHIRDVHFNQDIRLVLSDMNIDSPMMLQTVSWNTILRGCSLFMVSPRRCGKTLGYLPAVCRLVVDGNVLHGSGPMCIIVCATANAVDDVLRMAKMFLGLDKTVLYCYAGVDDSYITTELLNGCDVFICTPPALSRLLQQNDFGIDLRRLSILVLDDFERLTQTYSDELKFFQIKINAMLESRMCKQLKVQYILASRIWCDSMIPLAKDAPNPVICIGAFQECVPYSKANISISFSGDEKSGDKLEHVFEFLNSTDSSKKTVIVCVRDVEVELLLKALQDSGRVVFACDNTMTVLDLYALSESWVDFKEPVLGPILVCCDGNLSHLNVTDAHHLVHYSLPEYFSMFCRRFAVLKDNYPSIFKTDNENIKIKILLEEANMLQLPKLINFIKRCTDKLPSCLADVCARILAEKDSIKARKLIPLCDNLLQFGVCPDFYNCEERHTIFKNYDTPNEWVPTRGVIDFKIIYYHTATRYSARLLSVSVDGTVSKYPEMHMTLSCRMGMYFGKQFNRKLHRMPEIGIVCAVAKTLNTYARCQVIEVLSRDQTGKPNKVIINLIDEEQYEVARDKDLYYLPDDLKQIETNVVQIRLANLKPRDRDISFSYLARNHLRRITEDDDDIFMRGQVSLAIGNCIFVTTLEACQDLPSLSETVVRYNLKDVLLNKYALLNLEHLSKIKELYEKSGLKVDGDAEETFIPQDLPIEKLPKATWAHLESNEMVSVYVTSVISPEKFFVRLEKFESCMITLLADIKGYVDNNTKQVGDIEEGDIVLARFPDDSIHERARVDNIDGDRVKCFFVDQGNWSEVQRSDLVPIQAKFINELPFQAVECRLIGVIPPGEEWTDYSTNWFHNNCFHRGDLKHLFVKFYAKEPAEFTDGYIYSVVLTSRTNDEDTIVNELMIDLNLARESGEEFKYFEDIDSELYKLQPNENENLFENEVAREAKFVTYSTVMQEPLRSIPLVGSDEESEDSYKFELNICANTATELIQNVTDDKNVIADRNGKMPLSETKISAIRRSKRDLQELDSDDLTSPEVSEILKSPEKKDNTMDQKLRPKLIWRQNKSTVFVKIPLVVDNYDLRLEDRRLEFNAVSNGMKYEFDLELFGMISKDESNHDNKGHFILVKLVKFLEIDWLTLPRTTDTLKWIVYDVDFINTSSSDEETVDNNCISNILKNIRETEDTATESEDEDFEGDLDFNYKH